MDIEMEDAHEHKPFRMMDLPAELRLRVYDHVFLELTEGRSRDLTIYAHPTSWPNNDLTSYTNLVQTCKTINLEAKKHFESYYVHKLIFYFEEAQSLYNLAQKIKTMSAPYTSIKYVAHGQSPQSIHQRNDYISFEQLEHALLALMIDQSIEQYPDDDPELWTEYLDSVDAKHLGEGSEEGWDDGFRVVVSKHNDKLQAALHFPDLDHCTITALGLRDDRDTTYAIMSGNVADVMWRDYDGLAGQKVLDGYREWVAAGGPDQNGRVQHA